MQEKMEAKLKQEVVFIDTEGNMKKAYG